MGVALERFVLLKHLMLFYNRRLNRKSSKEKPWQN